MPDLDGTVKDYRNIDVGVRPGAAASLRTVKDELLETRTVDLFEALFEGGERGFDLGGERDGHGFHYSSSDCAPIRIDVETA
jgi:hypothetical protein